MRQGCGKGVSHVDMVEAVIVCVKVLRLDCAPSIDRLARRSI